MRAKLRSCLVVFGLLAAWTAGAVPNAVVDAVQAPAWVERGGRTLPLAPGMELHNRDRVLTGSGARAIVQLADGSAVKLGENVSVAVNAMQQGENGVFSAALDVAKGAFRLTTDLFRKYQTQRAINVRTGAVTIGIRGTDLWGRSNEEKDFVCLLEGKIAVSHPLGEPAELSEPLQFYGADMGLAPGPVAVADRAQVYQWALETELQYAAGTRQPDGRWTLRYGLFDEPETLALYDRFQAAGYAVKVRPVRADGGYLFEVRLGQLVSEREARGLADRLQRELQLPTHLPAATISRH